MNPGLAALWEEEIERRKVKKIDLDNLYPPPSQPRSEARPTASHLAFKKTLEERCGPEELVRSHFLSVPFYSRHLTSRSS